MFQELRASLTLLALLTFLTVVCYPLLMTGLGKSLFPYQANGSLVEKDGKIIGSGLIGQNFSNDAYFHPRPSAAGSGYDASNSSGSNLAPTAPDLLKTIGERVAELRKTNAQSPIPVDLVTASGSGLDPDISVDAANFQAPRIAQTRNLSAQQVQELISQNTTPRLFGMLGENRVNVLKINQALDMLTPPPVLTPTAQ
jgi:K+-transporting ATPase ATPase C chain